MVNYVILDTSIYRELGFKFYDNPEYRNLLAFTNNTIGEVLLSSIVLEEFTAHYKSNLIQKKNAYLKAAGDLSRDPFFFSNHPIDEGELEDSVNKAVIAFANRLSTELQHNVEMSVLKPTMIDGLVLTKFILNSREIKESNVQIRDYLIWDSILSYAKKESIDRHEKIGKSTVTFEKSRITFITKDKGFETNSLFVELREQYRVENIEVIKSIAEYLEKWGFYFGFISKDDILNKVKPERILKDLYKDIGALLSYVSKRYHRNCYDKRVEFARIDQIDVLEHYTYLDPKDSKHKFVAHIKVWVNVIFEKDEDGWRESIQKKSDGWTSLETYDDEKRPYFKKPILFFYGGLVDIERKNIKSVKFIDFLPDSYLSDEFNLPVDDN